MADSRNHRIQKFDINGNFVDSFGTEGNQSGQFNLPVSLIMANGNLFVNERGNERIQKFDADGNPILMWGSKGSSPSQFCHVEHLALINLITSTWQIHSQTQDVVMQLVSPNSIAMVTLLHNGNYLDRGGSHCNRS